jgi:hypothetical protein
MKLIQFAAILALAFSFGPKAHAQFDPGATMDLGTGMGSTALGQSILGGTREIGKEPGESDELSPTLKEYCAQWPEEGVCKADRERRANQGSSTEQDPRPSQEEIDAKMKAIAPEYNRRLQIDGKLSADEWLARTAREMGRRDGAAAQEAGGK